MRLLLKLESIRDQQYQMEYHYYLQAFIYNILKNSTFESIHNKKSYKFFCFSNIYPISSMIKKNDIRYIIISSPDNNLIEYLETVLKEKKRYNIIISIGNMKFVIKGIKMFDITNELYKKQLTFITRTPIVIRIPREKYRIMDIKAKHNYEYIYWRKEYPLMVFFEQLENNLYKKYKEFTGLQIDKEIPLRSVIKRLKFIKQIATKINMHKDHFVIIGTLWEFSFANNNIDMNILKFGLDCGFGERNSLGFGFMDIKT